MTKSMFMYAHYVIWYIATYCEIFCKFSGYSTYCNMSNMSKIDNHVLFTPRRNPTPKCVIGQLTCLLPPGIRIRMATDIQGRDSLW